MSGQEPEGGFTSEHTELTVSYRGRPLLAGTLPYLATLARARREKEIFPPFEYQDLYDPEDPDAPRPVRRARIVIEEI